MTEPEDLEEDLFADLYDGNDANPVTSTGAADSSVEVNTSAAAFQTHDTQNGKGPEAYQEYPTNDIYQGQDAGGAHNFQQGNVSQDMGGHARDGTNTAEADAPGTGIKEDG